MSYDHQPAAKVVFSGKHVKFGTLAPNPVEISLRLPSLDEILHMQGSGKNLGSYFGETIDIRAVLRDVETAAQQHGWTSEIFHDTGEFKLLALRRKPVRASDFTLRVYISADSRR